jgi:cation:H+ antiporter
MPDFAALGLWANVALFAGGTAVLWFAATRLALYADVIAHRFGLGQAVVGVLLLAGITSLPEIATSFSAAVTGEASLAINNLLGSIALQVAILAIADLIYDKRALTSVVPDSVVMLQGGINVILLAVVGVAVLVTDTLMFGAGLWTWGLAAAAFYGLRKIARSDRSQPWIARGLEEKKQQHPSSLDDSNARLVTKTAIAGAAILAGGFVAARCASALANETGLGASFMGVAFLALATSLPEVSTVFAAMRRGLYTMAISDILGTNIFNVALLFGIDIIASGGPVLERVGTFSAVGALIGVVVTGLFLTGLVERRDRTIWRMGIDSAAVLVAYAGGLAMLYTLR